MNFANLLLLLAMKNMMGGSNGNNDEVPNPATIKEKQDQYQEMAIQTRASGGNESDLTPMLQYFVKNPTGSDTGPTQERQEQVQQATGSDPLLSMFQQLLTQTT